VSPEIAMCVIAVVGDAPCQCFSPGSNLLDAWFQADKLSFTMADDLGGMVVVVAVAAFIEYLGRVRRS
jgi:hypothetical protein